MPQESNIYAALSGHAGLTALVPASRMFPGTAGAVEAETPFLVFRLLGTASEYAYGLDQLERPDYRIEIIASGLAAYDDALAIAAQVKAAIHGIRGLVTNELDGNADDGLAVRLVEVQINPTS